MTGRSLWSASRCVGRLFALLLAVAPVAACVTLPAELRSELEPGVPAENHYLPESPAAASADDDD